MTITELAKNRKSMCALLFHSPKATISVRLVTVMDAPALASALPARLVKSSLVSDFLATVRSRLNAFTITKASSTLQIKSKYRKRLHES